MIDINDYKIIYNQKIKKVTKIWCLIIIFIIVGIIFINKSFKYTKYYKSVAEYHDKYLNLYVLIDDLDKITNNEKIIIEEKEFAYKMMEIGEDNIYLNNNYYKMIKLSLDNDNLNDNEVIDIKIIIDETTILDYIFKTVWR